MEQFEWAAGLNPNPYKKRIKMGFTPADTHGHGREFRIVNGELQRIIPGRKEHSLSMEDVRTLNDTVKKFEGRKR